MTDAALFAGLTLIRKPVVWPNIIMCRALRFSLLPVFALLALELTAPSARSQIRDGGVDPANLGQGGWLYLLHNATNHLSPNNIAAVTNRSEERRVGKEC